MRQDYPRATGGRAAPAFSGQVRFEGQDVWTLKGNEFNSYRRAVQVVQQDPYAFLNPALNIGETLGATLLHHKVVRRRGLKKELLRILNEVGIDATPDSLRRYPHQLSGGHRPLDEPSPEVGRSGRGHEHAGRVASGGHPRRAALFLPTR